MKIENLKKNKCPECSSEMNWNAIDELLICEKCTFSLTEDQFTDYIDEIEEKEYHVNTYDENLDRLSRL